MTRLACRLAISTVLLVLGAHVSDASSMLPKPARKPWSVGLYPDIERDLEGCGRLTPNSLVCDPDQLISKEQADQVEDQLLDIAIPSEPHPNAACRAGSGRHDWLFQGYEVGMALADTIENRFGRPKRVAGNDFVFQLYHKWGLGTLECQAGMLVVVEQSMSQVYVYVGTGMQALATEERVNALIHHMERNLSKGQLVWALEVAANMSSALVRGELKTKRTNIGPTEATAILLGLVGLVLITAVRCCRSTRARE